MATVQDPVHSSPPKHEAFVESQLSRARRRIRLFDTTAALLGFVAGSLVFMLVMVLIDSKLVLPSLVRQIACGAYALLALAYLGYTVVRPLLQTVNPYFAALRVEQAVPGAKNSVVNWLDLRERLLPPAIRGAVSARAARDVAQADLDRAISGRRVVWSGALTMAALVATLVVLSVLRPGPFFSLLNRLFSPFSEAAITTRTRLELLEPQGGNTVVPVNQPVNFRIRVEGKVPEANKTDSLRLKFRYSADEPVYQERTLEPTSGTREWGLRLPAFEVKNGFWYRIAGGDAETPEYRVEVRSTPLLTRFEVKYHYRPYLHRKDRKDTAPDLTDLRGTEVTLTAFTNRQVKDGVLNFQTFEGEEPLPPIQADLLPNHPDALRFRFVLERDALYRIRFTSSDGEASLDSIAYHIRVHPDKTPQVVLTKPGKEITLPADGTLAVEGSATDDFGLTDLTLRMQLKGGVALQPRVYRGDEKKPGQSLFRFDDGTFPRKLDYKDFVELAKLKDEQGRPVRLKPDDEIEYWLEATDNCDYPKPNVGRSETYVVKIQKKSDDSKQQEEQRKQLEQEQKQHQDKQNQELQKENQEKQDQAKQAEREQQQKNDLEREAENLQKQLDKEQKGNAKPQELQPEDKGQQKGHGDQKGQEQAGQDKGQPKDKPDPKQQAELKPEGKDGKQDPKNPQGDKGQPKPDGGQQGGDPNQNAGTDKPQDKPQQGKGPGEPKDASGKADAGQQQSGKPKDKGDGKPGDQPGEGKKEGNPQQKAVAGAAKGAQEKPGQAKGDQTPQPGGNSKPDDKKQTGQADKGLEKKEDVGARSSSGPKGDTKTAGGEAAKEVAAAKPEGGAGSGAQASNTGNRPGTKESGTGGSGTKPGQEATATDVLAKANAMKAGGAGKKQAVRDLQHIAKHARKPDVRQAAKEALEKEGESVADPNDAENQSGTEPGQEATAKDVLAKTKVMKAGGAGKKQAVRDLQNIAKHSRKPDVRQAAKEALEKEGESVADPNDAENESATKRGQDATAKDVLAKANGMKAGGAGKKEAVRDLQNIAKHAKDLDVRQAAKEALEKEGEQVQAPIDPKELSREQKAEQLKELETVKQKLADQLQDDEFFRKALKDAAKNKDLLEKLDLTPKEAEELLKEGQGKKREFEDKKNDLREKLQDEETLRRLFEEISKDKELLKKLDLTPQKSQEFAAEWQQQNVPNIKAMENDLRDKLKAGELLLRRFDEVAKDKDALRRLEMTPEQAEKFRRDMAKQMGEWREHLKELGDRPKTDTGPLPYSSGPRKIKPTGQGRDPLQSAGPLQPPAEFEKSTRDFSQEISRIKPKRDK
jgi:hypothetical protein